MVGGALPGLQARKGGERQIQAELREDIRDILEPRSGIISSLLNLVA